MFVHLCYVPNGDHSLGETNALDTLVAFHHAIVHGVDRPSFKWTFPDSNTIRVETQDGPAKVLLWQATNTKTRDFRMDTIGRAYQSTDMQRQQDGTYLATVKDPREGWTAFLVQLEFDIGAATPMRLTTPVRVVPDSLPFANQVAPLSE